LWQGAGSDGDGTALALAWQIAQTRTPGGTWQHEGSELRLIGTRPVDPSYTLHANVGHAHNVENRTQGTTWGVALEHAPMQALPGLAPMAEISGDDRDPAWWNLGLRYTAATAHLSVDASYGRMFTRSWRSLLTFGLKLAF
jgi:hypothetical protein